LGNIQNVISSITEPGTYFGEIRAFRRDVTPFDLEISAMIVNDLMGEPLCMMASFVDITKQKISEAEFSLMNIAVSTSLNGIAFICHRLSPNSIF
jgi:hypothetical protein